MLTPILCLVYVLVSRAETWKPYNAPFKCYQRRGGGGRYYWMLIGWNRGQFIFWITRALLVIKRAWLLDWVFLLFAATMYWLKFNRMKQCNAISCIPPHMRNYNVPAVLSRTVFISTTRKKTPSRAWSGQTRHGKTVVFVEGLNVITVLNEIKS